MQKDTLGPYAESSSIHDDVYRSVLGMPGVAQAANVTYLPLQVSKGGTDVRAMVVGLEPDQPGEPGYLVAGRRVIRSRYEVVGLIGPSGSGKTPLLRCLGAVIGPTRGRVTLGGDVIYDNAWKISDLRALRRDGIGFIFQAPYLIPFLDVTDNVALLPMLAGRPNGEARARALAGMRILNQMASEYQTAIIVVTHDEKTIATFRRIYNIRDGRTFGKWGKGGRWSNRAKVIAGRHSRRRPLR